ncbi:MAG: class I SAM-dependent methyltransferase family protein [Desulfopila sp.]
MSCNIKEQLRHLFSDEEMDALVQGYDLLGDVAIIALPDELLHRKQEIAQAILASNRRIRLVACRTGRHRGEFRIASLEKIGGTGGFITLHKEYGVKLHIDPENVYFSPRSGAERYRIAQLVAPGEHVLVMFSGAGPLALMIAHHSQADAITGVEKNSAAHRLAVMNVEVNRYSGSIRCIQGDVKDIVLAFPEEFDRVVMPLPLEGRQYLDLALGVLRHGGVLHYYDFQYKGEFGEARRGVEEACCKAQRHLMDSGVFQCGHVGPRRYRVCVDATIR